MGSYKIPPPPPLSIFHSAVVLQTSMLADRFGSFVTLWAILGIFIGFCFFPGQVSSDDASSSFGRKAVLYVSGGWLVYHLLAMPLYKSYMIFKKRTHPFAAAVKDLQARVDKGLAAVDKNQTYTLFYPKPKTTKVDKALLFYPGFLVDPRSYAKILGDLAEASGVLIVLVDSQPSCIPIRQMGFTASHARAIMEDIDIKVGSWVLGGHCLGAYTASWLALELGVSQCVFWGCGHWYKASGLDEEGSGVEILTIDGSNDPIVLEWKAPAAAGVPPELSELTELAKADPKHHVVIEGGNHSGFGHYGPIFWPVKDGQRTGVITVAQQQAQVISHTTTFLGGDSKKKN